MTSAIARPVLLLLLLGVVAPDAWARTAAEAQFFGDCPHRRYVRLHEESSPWDLHALLYAVHGVTEVELVRAADWLIDLPAPGPSLRPLGRTIDGVRHAYHRLPPWRPIERIGEFFHALQLPQLSLGDARATYTVATGGTAGPASGMVVRLSQLMDWTQHVTGDVNQLAGWPVGRRGGLVRWSTPGRLLDRLQWKMLKGFGALSVGVARTIERSVYGVERTGEVVVNLGHTRPHEETAVFLRLSQEAYRAHELWLLEHRPRLIIGTAETFRQTTHAALAHRRRRITLQDWSIVDRLPSGTAIVILTTVPMIARAPAPLKAYVVPAAWILDSSAH